MHLYRLISQAISPCSNPRSLSSGTSIFQLHIFKIIPLPLMVVLFSICGSVLHFVTPEATPAPLLPFCPDPTVKRDGTVVQMPDCELRSRTSAGARDATARPVQKLTLRCARQDRRWVHRPAVPAAG